MAEACCAFKSCESEFRNKADLHDRMLMFKNVTFEYEYPPWEASEWDTEELKEFKFDTRMIDRVYYAREDTMVRSYYYIHLCGRLVYKGKDIYFRRSFIHNDKIEYHGPPRSDNSDDSSDGDGDGDDILDVVSYVTFNAQVFLKAVIGRECKYDTAHLQKVRKMMMEDGLQVEEPTQLELWGQWVSNGIFGFVVPSLWQLSQLAVLKNREKLEYYIESLPSTVAKAIKELIQVRDCVKHLDNMDANTEDGVIIRDRPGFRAELKKYYLDEELNWDFELN